ncbi:uncharacterized protein BHQ10_010406 [Talaromyces amestolkiae]|uniref:Uncharacterized protein n=1 Tax=Talaromyces amestolkiae TaxID=1196081 RepID=A0A364LF24_TALAM|nr:uncharacterized protein BHQ10_010406 [Talaromyces amestolkiae]RAO74393.1 hypothetical protein BHQ10_010406 [Talaromyces amestolkiae]
MIQVKYCIAVHYNEVFAKVHNFYNIWRPGWDSNPRSRISTPYKPGTNLIRVDVRDLPPNGDQPFGYLA